MTSTIDKERGSMSKERLKIIIVGGIAGGQAAASEISEILFGTFSQPAHSQGEACESSV